MEEVIRLVCGPETGLTLVPERHLLYGAPGGDALMHTGDGELFDRNVDTVTDNAEYRTRSVSAREVGWQTCPGGLLIGATPNLHSGHGQLDRKTTRGAGKRRPWEAEYQPLYCRHIA